MESLSPRPRPPALYFFNNFPPEPPPGSEEPSSPVSDTYEYPYECYVQVPSPAQLFVNRETRAVALEWIRDEGLEKRFREETQTHIFTRFFEPGYDVLYVPFSKWEEYMDMPGSVAWRPKEDPFLICCEPVAHLAVPAAVLLLRPEELLATLYQTPCPQTITIIFDAPPDLRQSEVEMGVPRRWELEDARGKGHKLRDFRWENDSDIGGFYSWAEDDIICEDGLEQILQGSMTWMRKAGTVVPMGTYGPRCDLEKIALMPAIAVKK